MRSRLLPLIALAFAAPATVAPATVASVFPIRLPPQEKLLVAACDTAASHIGVAVAGASTTQSRTIETELRVLKPGRLVGDIAFGRPGSSINVASDTSATADAKFNCGHGESAGRLGVGPGPARVHIVSALHETFTAPGRYTLTFTLNQAGLNTLAHLGAAERAYRKRHPHGRDTQLIAWGVGLHFFPVR